MTGHHGSIGARAGGNNETYVRKALEAGVKKKKTPIMPLDSTIQLLYKLQSEVIYNPLMLGSVSETAKVTVGLSSLKL